jgi:mannose-1-phosphate guanylyltransferase / phosphomannomutase
MARSKAAAIFLDRDGTLNEIVFNQNTGLLDSPLSEGSLRLIPKVSAALKILKSLGYLLIVITNQPAAAKGKVKLATIYRINNRLKKMLEKKGAMLDEIMTCPHHPVGLKLSKEKSLKRRCNCRKPKPGLFLKAINKFSIDIKSSYVVGDSYVDILAGKAVKLKTVFLGKYKCDTCQLLGDSKPDLIFNSLYEFAAHLKKRRKNERNR